MPLKYVSNFLFFSFILIFSGSGYGHNLADIVKFNSTFITSENSTSKIPEFEFYNDLAVIEGDKRFHKLTFTWDGPNLTESEATFRDYRLNVTFTSPSGITYIVPGYFAADGNAGETSAVAGNKWRCHFNALEIGLWTYRASFRTGPNIAVSFDDFVGTAVAPIDGDIGTFNISESDKSGKDFRAKGKLEYVGEHFQQWTDGDYFMKIGSNSPENLFEYGGFDDSNSIRTFPAHIPDFNAGDPTWKVGEGQGIIGAMNYLSNKGINSQYFVLHRKEEKATPWSIPNESYYTYDVSKMDQWQIVFDYMMQKGIAAHLVFSESQIQSIFEVEFPSGDLNFSDARKLYFREIIARFGYLNAVIWNIGEENGWNREPDDFVGEEGRALTTQQRLDFAAYIDNLVYYDDFITVHNGPSHDVHIFNDLQGENSIDGISMQGFFGNTKRAKGSTERYRNESATSGKKWVVYYDEAFEFGPLDVNSFRENVLWSSLTSGGAGIEHYATEGLDLTLEDLRFYDEFFTQMKYAYDFYHDNNIPFYDMYNQDYLVENGWCHGTEFNDYVIYITGSQLGNTTIDLADDYTVKWFNPRIGGGLMDGTITSVSAGDDVNIGNPPSLDNGDWIAVVRNDKTGSVAVTDVLVAPEDLNIEIGQLYKLEVEVLPDLADDKSVEWSSSDTSVATVDSDGNVMGNSAGSTIVTVTTVDGDFEAQATINVINESIISVTGITVTPEETNLVIGGTLVLQAAVEPADATNTSVVWTSDDTSIATVDANGELTGISFGTAIVRVSTVDGSFEVQSVVTVVDNSAVNVAGIDLDIDVATLEIDQTRILQAIVQPENATNRSVTWSSDDISIVSVDDNGEILGIGIGTTIIRATTEDGSFVAQATVTVVESQVVNVTGIAIEPDSSTLELESTLVLNVSVLPADATIKDVVWVSEDDSIVSVDSNGEVFGVGLGTAIVSASTVDGDFVAQTNIAVIEKSTGAIAVTGLSIDIDDLVLKERNIVQIDVTVLPKNASNTSIVWEADDFSIVTVDPNGNVIANKVGQTTITATTMDGGFSKTILVTVLPNTIILYPNPTNDFINISGIDERIGVHIHNSSGVLVKSAKGVNSIYVGDLSNGSYIVLLSTGDRVRFVKRQSYR